jgi:hypothetical protein
LQNISSSNFFSGKGSYLEFKEFQNDDSSDEDNFVPHLQHSPKERRPAFPDDNEIEFN